MQQIYYARRGNEEPSVISLPKLYKPGKQQDLPPTSPHLLDNVRADHIGVTLPALLCGARTHPGSHLAPLQTDVKNRLHQTTAQ